MLENLEKFGNQNAENNDINYGDMKISDDKIHKEDSKQNKKKKKEPFPILNIRIT